MRAKIAVIEFPGTNSVKETIRAVKKEGMDALSFRWNQDYKLLRECDGFIIGGGFSYEDRSRSGIIAALDPLIEVLKEEDKKDKPIFGICNGAQILLESAIVPGFGDYKVGGALTTNKRLVNNVTTGGFYNSWVNIKSKELKNRGAFLRYLEQDSVLKLPIANSEGRFVIPKELLDLYCENNLPMLFYCDEKGKIVDSFPINPNSSIDNLAALGNYRGNALAMMPHPERTEEGQLFFKSMKDYIQDSHAKKDDFITIENKETPPETFKAAKDSKEILIGTVITDNVALSVQQTLQKRSLPVKIERIIHWEIVPKKGIRREEFEKEVKTISFSGELFNPNKEFIINDLKEEGFKFLIRSCSEEEIVGKQLIQRLKNRYQIENCESIKYSVIWVVNVDGPNKVQVIKDVLKTNIFNNPFSHKRYLYE